MTVAGTPPRLTTRETSWNIPGRSSMLEDEPRVGTVVGTVKRHVPGPPEIRQSALDHGSEPFCDHEKIVVQVASCE